MGMPQTRVQAKRIARCTFHTSMRIPATLVMSTRKLALSSHRYSNSTTWKTIPMTILFTDMYLFSVSTSQFDQNLTSCLSAMHSNIMCNTETIIVTISR